MLFSANTSRWMSQPNSARITRSPFSVPSIARTDSRTLSSYRDSATAFARSRLTGKRHPAPRNSCAIGYPILTVPDAVTVPTGESAGSLQVSAVSPLRAAFFPPIFTVELPAFTVARFVGGLTKLPPCGTCEGELVAVLSTVAAGLPMILTLPLRAPSRAPLKGCGTSTGGAVPGGWIMCMSVPTTLSPCLAAGCPTSLLVQVDGCALEGHVARGFDCRGGARLDLHLLRLDLELALRRLQLDVLFRGDRDSVLGRIENEAVLAGLVHDLHRFLAVLVVERDHVAASGLDDAQVVLAVVVLGRRGVLAVPQGAHDAREPEVAVLEHHQHLVVPFRKEVHPPP